MGIAAQAVDDDAGLLRRIAAGERQAFALLMRRYNRRLYRLALAVLRDDAEAEDALQDAYLSAYRWLPQFRAEASVSTWLSRLVLNECLGRIRRNTRRQNVIPIVRATAEAEMDGMSDDDQNRPDQALARGQMRAILKRKLDALPDSFRAVLVLRSVEELSVEEAAQCLGISEATVRSRHFRARSLLREGLAQDIDLAERDLFDFGGSHCDAVITRVLHSL
ncbi:MAG: RNA polymerase sigma factor [Steroidobacteraceae bacterium]